LGDISKKRTAIAIVAMIFITAFSSVSAEESILIGKKITAEQITESNTNDTNIKYQEFSEQAYTCGKPVEKKKWTFMAYLDGDYYDLESQMNMIINDMELVGSTSDVNIVVQADDYRQWGYQTKRYYIEYDDNPTEGDNNSQNIISPLADNDTAEKNMGTPQTLIDFVCWAVNHYPAERYSLTLFNHGLGWKGICWDQTNSDWLDMNDLKYAMSEIYNFIGGKLDVLILNACSMGMIEVFYPLRQYVNFTISSESLVAYIDISFKGILENLTNQPNITPLDFSQKIIDTSGRINNIHAIKSHRFFAINMNKIDEIAEKVSNLSQALIKNMPPRIVIIIAGIYSFSFYGRRNIAYSHDIRRFAEKILKLVFNNDIKNKAKELIDTIDSYVIRPKEDDKNIVFPHHNGIAIYLPILRSRFDDSYRQLDFAKDNNWDELLDAFYRIGLNSGQQNSVQSSSTQRISSPEGKSVQKVRSNLFIRFSLASMFEKLFGLMKGFPDYTNWYQS
jgi:hypothetical protein